MLPSEDDIGWNSLCLLKASWVIVQKEIAKTPYQHSACSSCLSGAHLQEFGDKISTNEWSSYFQLMFPAVDY